MGLKMMRKHVGDQHLCLTSVTRCMLSKCVWVTTWLGLQMKAEGLWMLRFA